MKRCGFRQRDRLRSPRPRFNSLTSPPHQGAPPKFRKLWHLCNALAGMENTAIGKSRTKLALGATIMLAAAPVPVFAQVAPDAAPPSTPMATPAPPAPTASAPVVVIPEVAPVAVAPVATPIATAPVIQPAAPALGTPASTDAAPRAAARTPKTTSTAPAPRTTLPRQSEAAPPAAPVAAAVVPVAAPASTNPLPADQPADQIDGAPPVAAVNPPPANDSTVPAGLLGALGLAAVAGAGVFALRRRRPYADADELIVTPTEPVDLTPEPIAPAEARPLDLAAPVVASSPVTGPNALLTESKPAPTGEARRALLDQMVAAEPDEANPFRSAQARRRRARLILQSHDARAAEVGGTGEMGGAFDWRTWQGSGQQGRTLPAPSATPERVPEPVI